SARLDRAGCALTVTASNLSVPPTAWPSRAATACLSCCPPRPAHWTRRRHLRRDHAMSFLVVIPARAASTRLPGKPLLDLGGLPIVIRTARQAARSTAAPVLIATAHADIARVAADHGIEALKIGRASCRDRV